MEELVSKILTLWPNHARSRVYSPPQFGPHKMLVAANGCFLASMVQQRPPAQDDDAWAGWVFLASIACHDSTCSMRAPSHVSRQTPPGPRKPTQQAKGVATATDWPKRGSLSLTDVKAVAPIHGLFFGFVFIAPITSAERRMVANTSVAHRQCL